MITSMQQRDYELNIIGELIKEAYIKDTNRHPLIDIDGRKIHYLLLNSWCRDSEDRAILLNIIYKLIEMYPHRINEMTDFLLCKLSIIEDDTQEVQILSSRLQALAH